MKAQLAARKARLDAELSAVVRAFEEETGLTVREIVRLDFEPIVETNVRMGIRDWCTFSDPRAPEPELPQHDGRPPFYHTPGHGLEPEP